MKHFISAHQCPPGLEVQLLELSAHPKYPPTPVGRERESDPGLRMLFQACAQFSSCSVLGHTLPSNPHHSPEEGTPVSPVNRRENQGRHLPSLEHVSVHRGAGAREVRVLGWVVSGFSLPSEARALGQLEDSGLHPGPVLRASLSFPGHRIDQVCSQWKMPACTRPSANGPCWGQ